MEDNIKNDEIVLVYEGFSKIYKVSKESIVRVLGCEKEKLNQAFSFQDQRMEKKY